MKKSMKIFGIVALCIALAAGGGGLIANLLPAHKNSQNLTKVEMGAYDPSDNLEKDVRYYNVEQPFDPWINPTIDYENLPSIEEHPTFRQTYEELANTFSGYWGWDEQGNAIHSVCYDDGVIHLLGDPTQESVQYQTNFFAELWALLVFCYHSESVIYGLNFNDDWDAGYIEPDSMICVEGYKLDPITIGMDVVFPDRLTIALCYETTLEEIFPNSEIYANGSETECVEPSFFAVNDSYEYQTYFTLTGTCPSYYSYVEQIQAGATELEVSSLDDLIGISELLQNDSYGLPPNNLLIKQTADIYVGNNFFVNIVSGMLVSGLNLISCNAIYDGQGHGLYGLKLGPLGLQCDVNGSMQKTSLDSIFMGGTVRNLTLAGGALPGLYNYNQSLCYAFIDSTLENCVLNFDLSALNPEAFVYFFRSCSVSHCVLYGYSPMFGILDADYRQQYINGFNSCESLIILQSYGAYSPVCKYANKNNFAFMRELTNIFGERGQIRYEDVEGNLYPVAETFNVWRHARNGDEILVGTLIDNFKNDEELFIDGTIYYSNAYLIPQFAYNFDESQIINNYEVVKSQDWYQQKGLDFDFKSTWSVDPEVWNGLPHLDIKTTITWTTDGNFAESFAGGDGSETTPYEIANAPQLARLAYLVNNNVDDYSTKYYIQTGNIDLSAFHWSPINGFAGQFTGSCYKIIGMDVNVTENAALFGSASGTIENVYLEGIVSGTNNVAGILASGTATLSHSYFDGVFNLPDGVTNVGTLVGSGTGAVTNCGARVVINATSQIEVSTAGTCSSVYSEAVVNSGSGTTIIRKIYGTDFSNSVWFWDAGINEGYPIFKDWFWVSAFVPDISIYDKLKELGFVDA